MFWRSRRHCSGSHSLSKISSKLVGTIYSRIDYEHLDFYSLDSLILVTFHGAWVLVG